MSKKTDSLLISELILRRWVGLLGIVLPFALFFANSCHFKPSISEFYYADPNLPAPRDVFVGVMVAVGIFLCSYQGWDIRDRILSLIAGISALLVASVPCASPKIVSDWENIRGGFHLAFAAIFLGSLAIISYVQFTKTKSLKTMTLQKTRRNHVYRVCGVIMGACLLAIAVYNLFLKPNNPDPNIGPVFFLEAIAVIAFGVSWSVKGEVILRDK